MRGLWVVLVLALMAGCRSAGQGSGPYQEQSEARRDSTRAEELTREAAAILEADPERAEALLREALEADLFFGPAHNDLGVVFLKRGELYEAASEFEWARKLLPGHPDPRVNLALTLERAGRVEDALASYEAALDVYPEYVPAMQGAAALMLRAGREDERVPLWLGILSMRGEDAGWREWARGRLAARR